MDCNPTFLIHLEHHSFPRRNKVYGQILNQHQGFVFTRKPILDAYGLEIDIFSPVWS